MRKISCMVLTGLLAFPCVAQAGQPSHVLPQPDPGFVMSVENGVAVFRGQPSEKNAQYVRHLHTQYVDRREKAALKSQVFEQQRQIRQQAEELERVKMQLQLAQEQARQTKQPQRRSRYGRSYFGNPRFFGPNGFRGNRNFAGATVPTGRRIYKRRGRH